MPLICRRETHAWSSIVLQKAEAACKLEARQMMLCNLPGLQADAQGLHRQPESDKGLQAVGAVEAQLQTLFLRSASPADVNASTMAALPDSNHRAAAAALRPLQDCGSEPSAQQTVQQAVQQKASGSAARPASASAGGQTDQMEACQAQAITLRALLQQMQAARLLSGSLQLLPAAEAMLAACTSASVQTPKSAAPDGQQQLSAVIFAMESELIWPQFVEGIARCSLQVTLQHGLLKCWPFSAAPDMLSAFAGTQPESCG